MSIQGLCRCCMKQPPDRNLKSEYNRVGITEVYADILKECFEIHLPLSKSEEENGICEKCVIRLCDANDFRNQVLTCQKAFQQRIASCMKEEATKVKEEIADFDDNGTYFLDLKAEASIEYDDNQGDPEDDTKLAELLGLTKLGSLTVKRKSQRKKVSKNDKNRKKKSGSLKIAILSKLGKIINTHDDLDTHDTYKENELTKHRSNMKNILEYSNCLPFFNKTIAGIHCAYCRDTFPTPEELRNHYEQHHKSSNVLYLTKFDKNNLSYKMDITNLKCSLCNKNVELITHLKAHLTNEHDVKFYPDVNDYILEFKLSNSNVLKCALCNSTYETFKMLLQHMNGHYRNFVCEICDLGYINKHRLRTHQRTHELGNFKCNFCDKEFTTRVRKLCHEKYTHNTNARYTTNCPQCEKSFNSYYQRNRHMFNEHNTVAAAYKCNICDKSFILKSKLTAHIKKVHLMERNHVCSVCGQGFFIKQSLDEHMIKHNGERVFKCMVCHKAYARKKTLREHMRIHNNDRRFKCGICGLDFVQKCSMKSHMLSNHCITLAEYESRHLSVLQENCDVIVQ